MNTLPHQSPDYISREREIRELRTCEEQMRDRERQDRERQIDRLAREHQQTPLQSHAGSLPLHQPVASKVQGSLQGPNGLLGGGGGGGGAGAAQGPPSSTGGPQPYGTPPMAGQPAPQPYLAQPSPGVVHQQIANGQQPILNDELSYLDQVKVRCGDQSDVYNRFLDILKDFKSQAIDTPGVINRVSELFNGHPTLIQGFNTFLPPGYRIECGTEEKPDAIRVTTPSGTMTQFMQSRARGGFGTGPGFGQQPGYFGTSADVKRGGPVEFNQAISYVNKIKNRFAQQPGIYMQFVEILQTYQRESKPIQVVYSQVTQLFHSAPDLLEDFEQFLPETAAHAKAQAAARAQQEVELSSVRTEPGYAAALPQTQTPRPTVKLPPMGQFDPPSTSKENKKRKAPGAGISHAQLPPASDPRMRGGEVQPAHKRQKFDAKPKPTEATTTPAVDPTLVPALSEPVPPAPTASTTQVEHLAPLRHETKHNFQEKIGDASVKIRGAEPNALEAGTLIPSDPNQEYSSTQENTDMGMNSRVIFANNHMFVNFDHVPRTYGATIIQDNGRAVVGDVSYITHYHYPDHHCKDTSVAPSEQQQQAFMAFVTTAAAKFGIQLQGNQDRVVRWVQEVYNANVCATSIWDGEETPHPPSVGTSLEYL